MSTKSIGLTLLGAAVVGVLAFGTALAIEAEQKKKSKNQKPISPRRDKNPTPTQVAPSATSTSTLTTTTTTSQQDQSDELLRLQVLDYMQKDLENMMITFKKEFPDASFVEFMLNHFRENLKLRSDGSFELEDRVKNDNWEGAWHRVKATDLLHELGELPGQHPTV